MPTNVKSTGWSSAIAGAQPGHPALRDKEGSMSVKKRRFSIVIIAGLVVVLAGWLLAVGDGALAAQAAIRQRPKPAAATVHGPIPTPVPVVQPASLQVAYRLDPWMLVGNDGSD